ncbi:tripartite tricarboxylate transporter substrate binding protein [Humitalea sp. 24SJ18S-53]|uniref:tripartite tricarboxylate transporter substrate binding protein n=1 Tax=Humitalea sp. 24SJ18S-53 TaxID=3422307 RepID=UPI003D668E8D
MRIARVLAGLCCVLLTAGTARAQEWPDRPIQIVQGFAAGGNADTIARVIAQPLSVALGKPVVVEGRTGAGGNIASEYVARARPDGYTLVLLTGGHAVSAAVYRSLRFDPVADFAFISTVSVFPFVVATSLGSPITDMPSLIARARANPGGTTFSSVGVGSTQHLTGELLAQATGIQLTHVPYRGGTQPLTDLMSGRIDLMVDSITVTGGAIRAGTIRALGVTSAAPWPGLEVAPIAGTTPGFEVLSWVGLAAPAGTPAPIVQRLQAELARILQMPEIQRTLAGLGSEARASTPMEMRDFVAGQVRQWRDVVATANIERQ